MPGLDTQKRAIHHEEKATSQFSDFTVSLDDLLDDLLDSGTRKAKDNKFVAEPDTLKR